MVINPLKWFRKSDPAPVVEASSQWSPSVPRYYDGDKFPGGFGPTQLFTDDYWTLRRRSEQLFTENLYAQGLIKRLLTNEIGTGLSPECAPDEQILGLPEDSLADWTELTENRFTLWGRTPSVCDYYERQTFGEIHAQARREAIICGDVLVVLRQHKKVRLPVVQLIRGAHVVSPGKGVTPGHEVVDGVEHDSGGRVVAYWAKGKDGKITRIPAFGSRTGRRTAWLQFGEMPRPDKVRGVPLLSVVLQSLKEIDRYRDSTQRKAAINSIIAAWVEKSEDKISSLPFSGSAVRKSDVTQTTTADTDSERRFQVAEMYPGVIIEELQHGEKIVQSGGGGTDVNFGTFEEVIIQAVAWSREIPPEILRLAFSNNYSASQAAINEFKIYLNKIWYTEGQNFCQPIFNEYLVSEALNGANNPRGFLDAWRDIQQHDKFAAWTMCDWYGSIKPSTDMTKTVRASEHLISLGLSTYARESRITTGTKWTKNIKRQRKERQLLSELAKILPVVVAPALPEDAQGFDLTGTGD